MKEALSKPPGPSKSLRRGDLRNQGLEEKLI